MGGLAKFSPFVYVTMLISSLALAGFPFLAGFYSKDLIIETSLTKF
jgi:NADH:ubiquinone oxidoreductase subunit 5 (subunit L)/multisubunit Na+/H+ antiporter MnhA subunit